MSLWKTGYAIVLSAVAMGAGWLVAADYYWTGGGEEGYWSVGENWQGGVAPEGEGHTLHFDGNLNLISDNNDQLSMVSGIVFERGAGAFVLDGSSLLLDGSIVNYSRYTQFIESPLVLVGGTSVEPKLHVIDTAAGDIISYGGIGRSNEYLNLRKEGTGTLVLYGGNDFGSGNSNSGYGKLDIAAGTLLVDYTPGLTSGFNPGRIGYTANSATLEMRGTPINPPTNNWTIEFGASANGGMRMIVDSAVATRTIYRSGNSSWNVQLDSASASVTFSSLSNTVYLWGTVTDWNNNTRLMTINGSGQVSHLASYTEFAGQTGDYRSDHFRIANAGEATMGAGNLWAASMTITASGSLSSGATLRSLQTGALLIAESVGTGGYTFNIPLVQRPALGNGLYLYQYNTAGALTLNQSILTSNAAVAHFFAKSGPGTVIVSASSISSFLGPTYVQEGQLLLNGQFTRTGEVHVYHQGRLSGAGSIGATDPTALTVWAGGKLEASTTAALEITGSVQIQDFGSLVFALGNEEILDFLQVHGAVTLEQYANLDFQLDRIPLLYEEFLLLQATSISGMFSSVNGENLSSSGTFTVQYEDEDYAFLLYKNQAATQIWVAAIPEPTTVTLWIGLAGMAILCRKRGRNSR
jgi:hypothetical protein